MKAVINKILYWFGFAIIAVVLIVAALLVVFRFSTPYLESHHDDIQRFASHLVQQPVKFDKCIASSRGLEPVLKLSNVIVSNDAKTKTVLRVRELRIGIDLIGSLIGRKITPGLVVVSGINIVANQEEKTGNWHIAGIQELGGSTKKSEFLFDEILDWVFEQGRIVLSDINLTCKLSEGDVLKLTDLYLRLDNGVLQHTLKINGEFAQKKLPAKFYAKLKLRGNASKHTISSLAGDVVVEDWSSKLPKQLFKESSKEKVSFFPQTGEINLLIKQSNITSDLFRQPIPINKFKSKLTWQNKKDGLSVGLSKIKYTDNWFDLYGKVKLLFPVSPEGAAPIADIKLGFSLENLAKAKLYYPADKMPSNGLVWLDKSFIYSKPMTGTIVLEGPLDKFPFDNNEGRFLVDANLSDVHLDYDDEWPAVKNLNGKMIFSNRSMTIVTRSSSIMQAPVEYIKAVIPDLDMPVLSIDGVVSADSAFGLKFVNASPLKEPIGSKLDAINLVGSLDLDLKMLIPLSDQVEQKDTKVDGKITLDNNKLRPYGMSFGINNINGALHFTEDDLVGKSIKGELLDRPVELAVQTLKASDDIITRVSIQGETQIKNIEQAFSVGLSPYMTGNLKYRGMLDMPTRAQKNVFKLSSNLQGITVGLPAPFAKKPKDKGKLDVTCDFGGDKPAKLSVNYNDQVNAALVIKSSAGGAMQITGGEIKVGGEKARVPEEAGISVEGDFKKLDWPVWQKFLSRVGKGLPKAGAVAIRQIKLNISQLQILGQLLNEVALSAQPKDGGWQVALAMPAIVGELFLPKDLNGTPIKANFEKLYLDGSKKDSKITLKPQDIPALDLIIGDFRYGDKSFEKVKFVTKKTENGIKIITADLINTNFALSANGKWLMVGGKQHTVLKGKFGSNDIGGFLKKYGFTQSLVGGVGEADFDLKWPGPIYDPILRKASGSFSVSAKKGRIINFNGKTNTALSFGRLINALSLSQLSGGLNNLAKKGFSVNKMTGDFNLLSGNLITRNVIIDGAVALIKGDGRIGLQAPNQNCDINLSVTPHLTSSVPVIAAFAGGPVVGAISWVGEKLVSPVINKATTSAYHITGPFDNLTVDKG